ncbi:MAG: hypothetical protein ACRC5M_03485 [Anaeroplasmataceae bacterium]
MRLNLKSEGIRVEGHRGTWYVILKEVVKDRDNKSKTVYVLESEIWGEDCNHLYVDYQANVIDIFKDYGCLEDIINDFQDLSFKEERLNLEKKKQKALICKACANSSRTGECFCDIAGYCKYDN